MKGILTFFAVAASLIGSLLGAHLAKNALPLTASVATTVVAPTSAPTVTLSANPTTVASLGQPTTLTWSSTNASSCAASGAWSGAKATSGNQSVVPTATGAETPNVYTIVCTGAGGGAGNTVTVTVTPASSSLVAVLNLSNPTLSFSNANGSQRETVVNGGPLGSELTWAATPNASWLSINPSGDATGIGGAGGYDQPNVAVNPAGLGAGTHTGTITFAGKSTVDGSTVAPQTLTVTFNVQITPVAPASTSTATTATLPTATLSAAPTTTTLGRWTTLSWSSTNASSCAPSGGSWRGTILKNGSSAITPTATGTITYDISCTGPGGNAVASTSVRVVAPGAPTVTLSASPTEIALGSSTTLTIVTTNAPTCTASGAWSGTEPTLGTVKEAPTSTGTATYNIYCSIPGGAYATASALVTVVTSTASIAIHPSTPTNLSVTTTTNSTISLSWTTSTEPTGTPAGDLPLVYSIYRNNVFAGTSPVTSFIDTGLSASTTYSYTVFAYDQKGNTSFHSQSVIATTTNSVAPITPPSTGFTPAQLQAIYTSIVNEGIANKTLPANFASTVTVSFTATTLPGIGLYSYAKMPPSVVAPSGSGSLTIDISGGAINSNVPVIEVGAGITSMPEAQTEIAHLIGLAVGNSIYGVGPGQNSLLFDASQALKQNGVFSIAAISQINNVESAADSVGAKLIGIQNYINGLSAIGAAEKTAAQKSGLAPLDVDTLFYRAIDIPYNSTGTAYAIPANLIPGGTTNNASLTIEYGSYGTYMPATSPQLVGTKGLINSIDGMIFSETNSKDVVDAEYSNGGNDLFGIGAGAPVSAPAPLPPINLATVATPSSPLAGLNASQLTGIYNALAAAGIKAGLLSSSFSANNTFTFAATQLPGLGSYTPANSLSNPIIEVGFGVSSTIEAQAVIAQQIGIAQNQTLENAAAAATNKYGVDSPQAITAVNNVEAAADAFAAQLIGAQNYINGLSAIETGEALTPLNVTTTATGIIHIDGNTLFNRVLLVAQANHGTEFSIPATLVPGDASSTALNLEYSTTTGGGIDAKITSVQLVPLAASVASTLAKEIAKGDATDAEYVSGGSNLTNVGINAPTAFVPLAGSFNSARLQSIYNTLVASGIKTGSLPSNFTTNNTFIFTTNQLPSIGEYASGANGAAGQITIGSGITTTNEARTVIAQQIGLAENQSLVNAAATAVNIYGINSFEAITAVNTTEAAADAFAAQLIGAQNYINGLSAIEATQIATASSTGIMPADVDTLFERARLIAFTNPNVTFNIPANMIPNADSNNPPVPMEYTAADGVESLESPGGDSSALDMLSSYNVSTALIEEESGSNPSYTEFGAGGGNMPNIGWGALITNESGVVNAWLNVVQLATTAGVDSSFLSSLSRNLQYDSDESDIPHACDSNCVKQDGTESNGPTITLSSYLFGSASMWDEATMAHEIGHTLTPNEVAWAQVAAENYNNDWDTAVNALSQYGVGSEQYYVASLPLANDWNAAVQAGTNKELVASVVGAQIFGNAYEKSGVGTFADGVQAFVNTYIGNEAGDVPPTYNPPTNNPSSVNPSNSDTGFDYHGTPLQQIISIANANPSITVTIPENIIADAQKTGEIGPNDYVPGATYFISPTDGKLYYTVPWGAPPMPDIAPPPPPTDDVSAPAPASPSPAPATDVQPAADAAAQQDVAANDGTTATVASVVDNNSGDINSGDLSDSFTSDDSGDQDIYMGGPTCDSENSCQ